MKLSFREQVGAYLGFFGMPLLAIGLIARGVYIASFPDPLSPFWATVVGLVLGVGVVGAQIVSCGSDMMNFLVPSIFIVLFCLCCWYLPQYMKEKRLIRHQQQRLLKKPVPLRTQRPSSPTAPPTFKAP